jgi:hypothetical protein
LERRPDVGERVCFGFALRLFRCILTHGSFLSSERLEVETKPA